MSSPWRIPAQVLAALLSLAAYLALAYATPRAHTGQLLGLFAIASASYVVLVRSVLPLRAGLGLALLFRLLWLPATPALSDDFYRFRWDGLLATHGINPFQYRPAALVSSAASEIQLAQPLRQQLAALYPRLNSPNYFSVYPPVCQAVFAGAASLFADTETGFIVVLRLVLLAAECGTAWLLLALLPAWGWPRERALLYLLHPLPIAELTGNLHFEAAVIGLVLLACWLLARQRWAASAVALGLAVATKLLPLLLLPLLARRLGWPRFLAYCGLVGGTTALLFAPFLSADLLANVSRSLNLYFQSFEFNASLYYVLRALGYHYQGYNEIAIIGPALAVAAALGVLLLAGLEKRPALPQLPAVALAALTLYYLCATTVHPWYLTPLLALSVLSRWRYPLVWGTLAVLSYAAYSGAAAVENSWLLALEYLPTLAILAIELEQKRRPDSAVPGDTAQP